VVFIAGIRPATFLPSPRDFVGVVHPLGGHKKWTIKQQVKQQVKQQPHISPTMKKYSILFGAVCAVILAFSQNAKATAIFTSELTVSNLAGMQTGDFGTVTISLSGQTATITFTAAAGFSFGDGSSAAVNLNTDAFTEAFVTESPSNNFKAFAFDQQVDGFGQFDLALDQKNFAIKLSSITFTVTNTSGSTTWLTAADVLAFNSGGWDAAAHIFSSSTGKTGFAAEGAGTPPPPHTPDGGTTAALLGLGLAGLAGLRAKFGKK
jgi:VPDSG-CTERM motif